MASYLVLCWTFSRAKSDFLALFPYTCFLTQRLSWLVSPLDCARRVDSRIVHALQIRPCAIFVYEVVSPIGSIFFLGVLRRKDDAASFY